MSGPGEWNLCRPYTRAFFHRNRHLLDDFEAEAFEGRDVHGRVGEQADALDAEVGEDLAAEADGAQDAAGAGLGAFAGAQFLMQDEAAGMFARVARRRRQRPRAESAGAGVWSISNPREVLCR